MIFLSVIVNVDVSRSIILLTSHRVEGRIKSVNINKKTIKDMLPADIHEINVIIIERPVEVIGATKITLCNFAFLITVSPATILL